MIMKCVGQRYTDKELFDILRDWAKVYLTKPFAIDKNPYMDMLVSQWIEKDLVTYKMVESIRRNKYIYEVRLTELGLSLMSYDEL